MKVNKRLFIVSIVGLVLLKTMSLYTLPYFSFGFVSQENTFSTGEWIPAQTNVFLKTEKNNFTKSENIFSYNTPEGERYILNYNQNIPQYLSFEYKVNTTESAFLFDDPNIVVFANEIKVLEMSITQSNSQFQTSFIDLSQTELETGEYTISFRVQNTFDEFFTSQIEIKSVTTAKLFLQKEDILEFSANKEIATIFHEYEVEKEGVSTIHRHEISAPFEFRLSESIKNNELWYWSVDLFGNKELENILQLEFIDTQIAYPQLQVYPEGESEISVQVSFENPSKVATKTFAKISATPMNSKEEWDSATTISMQKHQQFKDANTLYQTDQVQVIENLLFTNVPLGNKYLAIQICDQKNICSNRVNSALFTVY